jgi:hypothetical protein
LHFTLDGRQVQDANHQMPFDDAQIAHDGLHSAFAGRPPTTSSTQRCPAIDHPHQ